MATKKRGKVANGGKMKKKKMGPKGYARGGVMRSNTVKKCQKQGLAKTNGYYFFTIN